MASIKRKQQHKQRRRSYRSGKNAACAKAKSENISGMAKMASAKISSSVAAWRR